MVRTNLSCANSICSSRVLYPNFRNNIMCKNQNAKFQRGVAIVHLRSVLLGIRHSIIHHMLVLRQLSSSIHKGRIRCCILWRKLCDTFVKQDEVHHVNSWALTSKQSEQPRSGHVLSKSPVSATTVVTALSCSREFAMVLLAVMAPTKNVPSDDFLFFGMRTRACLPTSLLCLCLRCLCESGG